MHSKVYNYEINQVVDFMRRTSQVVLTVGTLCYWTLTSVYTCTSVNVLNEFMLSTQAEYKCLILN